MKTCWICEVPIPPGEASRDHIIPRSRSKFRLHGNTRWADKACNSARGNMDVEQVESIKAQGLSQAGLRLEMIEQRRDRWQPRISREACEQ